MTESLVTYGQWTSRGGSGEFRRRPRPDGRFSTPADRARPDAGRSRGEARLAPRPIVGDSSGEFRRRPRPDGRFAAPADRARPDATRPQPQAIGSGSQLLDEQDQNSRALLQQLLILTFLSFAQGAIHNRHHNAQYAAGDSLLRLYVG